MAFEKGRGKTGGRQLGSSNKATTHIKSRIAALIDNQFDSIEADLETLEPKDRITAYLKFLEYILPKQREQIDNEPEMKRRVSFADDGSVVIEMVPVDEYSTPFQIINPDTGKVEDLDIGADKST